MFSSRFKWNLESNRITLLLEEKHNTQTSVLDLTESNPTRVGYDFRVDKILGALSENSSMIYEPEPRGLRVAREAVAGYYLDRGFDVDPERIHLTASTSEGYSYLFKLLADQGESILVPQPSYPLFEFLAALEGVELRYYELQYNHPTGWQIDLDSIERSITADTRAIIIVNPNNPTGSFIKKDEAERINGICSRNELALIVDEVFSDYAFETDNRRTNSLVLNDSVLTFVMSGISKILALPQMKLGWIVTNGPDALCNEAIERLDVIADTFLSVSAPVQHAAPEWLKFRATVQAPILSCIRDNLKWLTERAENSSCRLLSVEGGWYTTLEVPRLLSEEEWVLTLLGMDNVLVHPGYFFDFPREAFLVLSLLPKPEIFREAINRVLARVNQV